MAWTQDLGWPMARCDGEELEIMIPESEDSEAKSLYIKGRSELLELARFIQYCVKQRDDELHRFPPGISDIAEDDVPQ